VLPLFAAEISWIARADFAVPQVFVTDNGDGDGVEVRPWTARRALA
jgi:hypothetical protein